MYRDCNIIGVTRLKGSLELDYCMSCILVAVDDGEILCVILNWFSIAVLAAMAILKLVSYILIGPLLGY